MTRRLGAFAAAAIVLTVAACGSPARRPAHPSQPARAVDAATPAIDATDAIPPPSGDAIDDAHALWIKLRANAEKAAKVAAGDPNEGWLHRAVESDGRALFHALGHPAFDRFPVERGAMRARILLVVKPPAPEDRREAIAAIERDFDALLKRRSASRAPG